MPDELKRLLIIFLTAHRESSVALLRLISQHPEELELNTDEPEAILDVADVLGELDLSIERAVRELKKELDNA